MTNGTNLPPIRPPQPVEPNIQAGEGSLRSDGDESFASLLRDGIERLERLEAEADEQVRRLYAGEPVELHRVILAGEEAGLAFELMLSIRNKAVEAYQEIMRMQV